MSLTYPSGHESTPVTEAGDPVNVLAFCDDLVIISKTWKGLQDKLDYLLDWSPHVHIAPHSSETGKSFILVFGKPHGAPISYSKAFRGHQIDAVLATSATINFHIGVDDKYQYLGYIFSTNKRATDHIDDQRKKLFAFLT